ncbi:hypothetical protein GCM10018952_60770 [Streptosporangium vulgare]
MLTLVFHAMTSTVGIQGIGKVNVTCVLGVPRRAAAAARRDLPPEANRVRIGWGPGVDQVRNGPVTQ